MTRSIPSPRRPWPALHRSVASPGGFALLIVLWSVVLLALLTTVLTASGRSEVQLAGNLRRAAAAEAAADAGIAEAVFHASDAPARAWQADGQPHLITIGAYAVRVQVGDENGKLNPNYAPPQLMAAVIAATGVERTRAAAIAQAFADWHAISNLGQVEAQYRQAGMAAAPTGQPFRSLDELGLVIGMTPDSLARIRPYLSVFTNGPLELAHAAPLLREVARTLEGEQPQAPDQRPSVINVMSDAQAADGSRFVRHAVVALGADRAGRPFQTLQWDSPQAP